MIQNRPVDAQRLSLADVHDSVLTAHPIFWKRLLAFAGPAYLISVGYMDPGNWATDLEGGARFGYRLLWVVVMSNFMAILLQTLSARLGIVTGRDLAQACRDEYSKSVSIVLWLLCELAIVGCDLAEVLGAAIGLNLLFHVPLLIGVLVTALDTLLLLWFTRLGIRVIEAFVLVLIATIAGCFAFEIFFAQPHLIEVAGGLIPRLNSQSLYVAVAIIGATVMPHNLYLHSALVQTRRIGATVAEKRTACNFNFLDSTIALNGALFVNAAILILAASVFFKRGIVVTEIQQAHQLLTPLLGTTAASVLFGAALLASGQSSTLTGTMAGQVVMEGFLHFKMQPWLRRLVTRCLAITPAALTIYFAGDSGGYQLLILSQVVLNLQLPFAVIPLIEFTNDRKRMGEFASGLALRIAAWTCATVILTLDLWLIWTEMRAWIGASGAYRPLALGGCILIGIGFCALLVTTVYGPRARRKKAAARRIVVDLPSEPAPVVASSNYSTILVPLDHSMADREAIANALGLARLHNARMVLLHVEEGVTSQLFGSLASTAEVTEGVDYLNDVVSSLRQQHVNVDVVVRHGSSPAKEIIGAVKDIEPDLLVMASHGHRGIKDLVFGTTINNVRHHVKIPMLIVSSS
ncbi:MAG: Nramp family divalent metal transporter [Bryobacteraceae bacterium]